MGARIGARVELRRHGGPVAPGSGGVGVIARIDAVKRIGIEHVDDLVADIDQALAAAA